MKNIAYKNHDDEIKELIDLLIENRTQIILYNSHEGYGNTAFIQRIMYLLHATPKYQLLHAELSPTAQNPLHEVTKNIVCKKGSLYHRLQLFSDEQNFSQEIPVLLSSIIKDVTKSETISSLLNPQEAIPIYAGFYQDRLKHVFFELIQSITENQRLFFFIDNIQYMDNDSLYELQALLQNPKITLIIFKSSEGTFFNKFYDEIKYRYSEVELYFPEPDVPYVQKLASLYNKNISEYEAVSILSESKKNVRKILCHIRKNEKLKTNPMVEDQILKILTIYNDYITTSDLSKIFSYTPYVGVTAESEIAACVNVIECKGLLQTITSIDTREKQYKTVLDARITIDVADKFIINRALSDFYN